MYGLLALVLYALPFAAGWFAVAVAGAPLWVGVAVTLVLLAFVAAGFSDGPVSGGSSRSYGDGGSTFIYVSDTTEHHHHHDPTDGGWGGGGGDDVGGDCGGGD